MDNYGMNMFGSFVVERVQILPDWGTADMGRMLYDLNTENYYLGGPAITVGVSGWIPIGITQTSIRSYNIDWDTDMTGLYGKVSASNIPCSIDDTTSNVNDALNALQDSIDSLQVGDTIEPSAVKSYHLDITGINRIDSAVIPIDNSEGYFTGETPTIEDALTQLQQKNAGAIELDLVGGTFGDLLGFTPTTIQNGFQDIEEYLNTFTAADLPCHYEGCACDTNVQFVIDALYNLHVSLKITDMVDVPDYSADNRYLKSNGVNNTEWVELVANDVTATYPGTTPTNVQGAIMGN